MNKVHAIASKGQGKIVTFCGRVGYPTAKPNEFDTPDENFGLECAPTPQEITCQRCLRSIKLRPHLTR